MLLRSAHDLEDLEDLVYLRVAREQWSLAHELGKDATDAPHVNSSAIALCVEKHLGCPVP